jgi:hypothetical protein
MTFFDVDIDDMNSLLPDLLLPKEDSAVFCWNIASWRDLKASKKSYSPSFTCGGSQWCVAFLMLMTHCLPPPSNIAILSGVF